MTNTKNDQILKSMDIFVTYPLELLRFWPLNVNSLWVSDKSDPLVTALLLRWCFFMKFCLLCISVVEMWLFVTVVVLLPFMTRFFAKPSKLSAVVFFRLWKKYLLIRKTRFNPYEPKKKVFRGYWNEKFCSKFDHYLELNASFSNLNRIWRFFFFD